MQIRRSGSRRLEGHSSRYRARRCAPADRRARERAPAYGLHLVADSVPTRDSRRWRPPPRRRKQPSAASISPLVPQGSRLLGVERLSPNDSPCANVAVSCRRGSHASKGSNATPRTHSASPRNVCPGFNDAASLVFSRHLRRPRRVSVPSLLKATDQTAPVPYSVHFTCPLSPSHWTIEPRSVLAAMRPRSYITATDVTGGLDIEGHAFALS